jgi:hypothetical protein
LGVGVFVVGFGVGYGISEYTPVGGWIAGGIMWLMGIDEAAAAAAEAAFRAQAAQAAQAAAAAEAAANAGRGLPPPPPPPPGNPPPPPCQGPGAGLPRPTVAHPKLQNLVRDLYKGANGPNPIGSGSTADAIRFELACGQQVGGRWHSNKGREYIRALRNWLTKNQNADAADRNIAQQLLDDLVAALGGN